LAEVYPQIEKISFDNAVLEKMDPKFGYVISVDLEWSEYWSMGSAQRRFGKA